MATDHANKAHTLLQARKYVDSTMMGDSVSFDNIGNTTATFL
jgi:hypothetical protein